MAQWEKVYITNLENDLQNCGTKVNEEEGPKDKSLQKTGLLKGPPQLILITALKFTMDMTVRMITLKKTKKE